MSFGFSVGDFLAVAGVIKNIISCLRGDSASSYQELVLELQGLQRALHEIEHLQCRPSQQAAVASVKVAALMCQYPLDEFSGKLRKYEALEIDQGNKSGKAERLKLWKRKLQWGFSMEEEVIKLRAYIAAHVGSLNMRLITLGLSSNSLAVQKCDEDNLKLQSRVENTHLEVIQITQGMDRYGKFVLNNNTLLQKLTNMISGGITLQLSSLVDMVNKIWNANVHIMAILTTLPSTTPQPNTSYTWFQEPVRFEDALGRVFPIPSEYNWGRVDTIILDQFAAGPGSEKVRAGEYVLFNSFDATQSLTASTQTLTPGMCITMAILVGRYGEGSLATCPRVGCNSRKIEKHVAGGNTCTICNSWFVDTEKKLPLPLRPDHDLGSVRKGMPRLDQGSSKMASIRNNNQIGADLLRDGRNERRNYKNISIHFTELPKSPSVSNVRARQPRKGRKIKGRKSVYGSQYKQKKKEADPFLVQTQPPEGVELNDNLSMGNVSLGDEETQKFQSLVTLPLKNVSYIPIRDHMGLTMERIEQWGSSSVVSEPRSIDSSSDSSIGLYPAPSEYFGTDHAWRSPPELQSCLRCRLLKQTCDEGEPCAGCRLSRWHIPCTRMVIQDLDYFMAKWHSEFEENFAWGTFLDDLRRGSAHSGYWIDNIRPSDALGYNSISCFEFPDGDQNKILWVSHGYGFAFPIMVCKDETSPEGRFTIEWQEFASDGEGPISVKVQTGRVKLCSGGLSMKILEEYLGRYLDNPLIGFVNISDGIFIPEVLQTIRKYHNTRPTSLIRQALTIVTSYDFAKSRTIIEHKNTENNSLGQVLNPRSKYYNMIIAPPEINASISAALTSQWQDLQKATLSSLSRFYEEVYVSRSLRNHFEIFALSAILLIIWEEMMFDYACHMRDTHLVQAFWTELKDKPVDIILGLFTTISEVFPTFLEWDTEKHGALVDNDVVMCEAMTQMRENIKTHEAYLRSREYLPYDRSSFGFMSNVFLSKLVLKNNEGGICDDPVSNSE